MKYCVKARPMDGILMWESLIVLAAERAKMKFPLDALVINQSTDYQDVLPFHSDDEAMSGGRMVQTKHVHFHWEQNGLSNDS